MYDTEYSWTSRATNVTSPSMVTDSRSTVTPQVMLVSPIESQLMLKKASPLLSNRRTRTRQHEAQRDGGDGDECALTG